MWKKYAKASDFSVSDDGRIRSHKRKKTIELKAGVNSRGYPCVAINGISKCVHRLVAETYIPNPENHREINHIDGNKMNNHVSNLEWCSRSQNIRHAYNNGLRDSSGSIKACGQPIMIVETGEKFRSISECARYLGVSMEQVRCCLDEKKTQHHSCKGYHFVKLEEKK